MLQDVWDARIIWGVSLEPNREDIVAVVASDVEVFGTRLVVPQVQRRQLKLGDMLRSEKRETMEFLAGLRKLGEVGRSSSRSACSRTAKHLDKAGRG